MDAAPADPEADAALALAAPPEGLKGLRQIGHELFCGHTRERTHRHSTGVHSNKATSSRVCYRLSTLELRRHLQGHTRISQPNLDEPRGDARFVERVLTWQHHHGIPDIQIVLAN